MADWSNASTTDLRRSLNNRVERLNRLTVMHDEGIAVPEHIVSSECDLVRQAVERLENRYVTDPEAARAYRDGIEAEIEKQIEEAGGQEAWEQKIELELGETEGNA